MSRITQHSKSRLVEREEAVENYADAKRMARLAWNSGLTVNHFQIYPKFFSYLSNKRNQTNTCHLRVYRNNIYIWRGRNRSLVTVHPIPTRYLEEMDQIDKERENGR